MRSRPPARCDRAFSIRLGFVLAFLLIGATAAHSAVAADSDTQYRFEHISVREGLSHNVVYAILQDRFGFMWIGTENGLNKFDGHSFTVYEHSPADSLSLSDSRITSLLEDSRGNLWVGTRWGGLNRFNREDETFTRYPIHDCSDECDRPTGINDTFVSSLHEDRSGAIWIGTFEGLSRLDPNTGEFDHYRHRENDPGSLSSDKVWSLDEDADGNILVGTWNSGLNRFDMHERAFTRYAGRELGGPLEGNRIRALRADQYGNVWVGISGGGLNHLDPQTGTVEIFLSEEGSFTSLPDNKVWSIFQDSRGVLWVGTYESGLARFDRSTKQFRRFQHDPSNPSSISSNVVSTIYEDRSGNLWVGSERGLSIYNLAQERHQHYTHRSSDPNSLASSEVLALYQNPDEPNKIWIGTNGGGINRFDIVTERFDHVAAFTSGAGRLTSDVVTSIDGDDDGGIWIGTSDDGLNRLDVESGRTNAYRFDADDPTSIGGDAILDVVVDDNGHVWAATDGGGLSRLDPELGTFVRYRHDPFDPTSISDNSVQTIFEGRDGTLWIGTVDGGLNRLEPGTDSFQSYRHVPGDPTSLSHNRIASIYEDDHGVLWIGTFNGLNRFDPKTGVFHRYTREDGLPSEPYFAIEPGRSGGLWLTAASRLSYFDPETGLVRHFSSRNGLSPNQYSVGALVITKQGSIIVGGRNGFSHFHPPIGEYNQDRHPPLVVTALKKMDEVSQREIFSGETISLSYVDRFFTLEFAVLDYTDPDKHQYQFRLEGYDAEWQHMTGPIGRASYANFRPARDEYVFRIRASNSQGAENRMWLRVKVIPPWWKTLWFRVSAFLAVGLLGGTVVMYRYNRQKREKAETLRLLTEGRERERQYLARELHDSPLQNLYSIRHKLEVLARNPADPDNEKVLDDVHSVVDRTAEDLRILCGELRPPSLGPFGLEKAIRAHIRTIQRSHPNLNVALELAPDGQTLPEHLRHSLFRIYQSAITNVTRHAGASNLWVKFELFDGRVLLEVADDGRGFNVPKSWLTLARSQHFGLLGISEWAEAIEADLHVDSSPGEGTTVRIVAPRPVEVDA